MGEPKRRLFGSKKTKSPEERSGLASGGRNCLLGGLWRESREFRFERLIGFLGGGEVEFAKLVNLGEERLIGFLRIPLLDLKGLLERFGGSRFLESLGTLLERLAGKVDRFGGDRLEAFGQSGGRRDIGVDSILPKCLELFKCLHHWVLLWTPVTVHWIYAVHKNMSTFILQCTIAHFVYSQEFYGLVSSSVS